MAGTKGGKRKKGKEAVLPTIQPDTAGVDVGAREIYVAVPVDRDEEAVRHFTTFTEDLHKIAGWLKQCKVKSVAMEATGVYWIPLYQVLEEAGLEVCLVNARHFQHVPGRKSDVADCQWLQYLHSVGLLRSSFRPAPEICALRTLWRHRESLVQMAAEHVQHMQKALDQMNVQLHHVISDITGVTGLAIVEAIIRGERNPQKLAQLRQERIQASEEVIAKSLVGDYRDEHLMTLRQSLEFYRIYQKKIDEVDEEVCRRGCALPSKIDGEQHPLPPSAKKRKRPQHNAPRFDMRGEFYRLLGTDLTQVPGLECSTIQTVVSEIGPDFSKFRGAAAFASWLTLCPDREVSGGKVLRSRTRKARNRVAIALRVAAQTLHHSRSFLGQFYRRMRTKLGAPKAITAAAHKLARIIYRLVTKGEAYDESVFAYHEAAHRLRMEARLRRQALRLGFQLLPIPTAA